MTSPTKSDRMQPPTKTGLGLIAKEGSTRGELASDTTTATHRCRTPKGAVTGRLPQQPHRQPAPAAAEPVVFPSNLRRTILSSNDNGNHLPDDNPTPADAGAEHAKSWMARILRQARWLAPFLTLLNFAQSVIRLGIGSEGW